MITLQEMAVLNSLYALVDLKNQLLLISFFLLLFLMHHIPTHNLVLGSIQLYEFTSYGTIAKITSCDTI